MEALVFGCLFQLLEVEHRRTANDLFQLLRQEHLLQEVALNYAVEPLAEGSKLLLDAVVEQPFCEESHVFVLVLLAQSDSVSVRHERMLVDFPEMLPFGLERQLHRLQRFGGLEHVAEAAMEIGFDLAEVVDLLELIVLGSEQLLVDD